MSTPNPSTLRYETAPRWAACPGCGATPAPGDPLCGSCRAILRAVQRRFGEPPVTSHRRPGRPRRVRCPVVEPPWIYRLLCLDDDSPPIDLDRDDCVIGSGDVDFRIKTDPCLDREHCRLSYRRGRLLLTDLQSVNGTFRRLRPGEPVALRHGTRIGLASTLWRFEVGAPAAAAESLVEVCGGRRPVGTASLVEVLHGGRDGDRRFLRADRTTIGRGTEQDLPLAGDPLLSRSHARIDRVPDGFLLCDTGHLDRGSAAGTYIEVLEPVELRAGDTFRAGSRRFQVLD